MVIAISQKGAWAGHFWETPYFTESTDTGDFTAFDEQILPGLDNGVPGGERIQYVNQYALGQLRSRNDNGELGHMFDDVNNPRLFFIYPRKRVSENGEWNSQPNAGKGTQLYPVHNMKILQKLRQIFGAEVVSRIGTSIPYSPLIYGGFDDGYDTSRGKLLIQYMPAIDSCPQGVEGPQAPAKARLFIENGKFLS